MGEAVIRLDDGQDRHELLKFDPNYVTRTKIRVGGIPEEAAKLTLLAKFSEDSCPHCDYKAPKYANWGDEIRSAFIVPVSDSPCDSASNTKNNSHSFRDRAVEVPISSWNEGGKASVVIDLEDFPGGDLELMIETSWEDAPDPEKESSRYLEGACPHITVSTFIDDVPKQACILKFEISSKPITADSNLDLMRLADGLGAYGLDGEGYSIHPKQILTSGVLERLLNNELLDGDGVSITYLGSDTAENLYSVIRSLRASGLWDRVSSFEIYFHPGWDKKYFDQTKTRVKLLDLPEIEFKEMGRHEPNQCDVTICTYVSPWAFADSEMPDKQEEFREFLRGTLKMKRYLISVDPERDTYVRGRPYPPQFNIHNKLYHVNGWKKIEPSWKIEVPEVLVSNWAVLQKIPLAGDDPSTDEDPPTDGPPEDDFDEGSGDGPEDTGGDGWGSGPASVESEFIESMLSILGTTRCASEIADAEKMYYSPLRFVDGGTEFWKNIEDDEFEGMSWGDFWKDGRSPASLFDNDEAMAHINDRVSDWLEEDMPRKADGTHVLTSEAGMGKSTSFRWMARKVARARRDDRDGTRLPLLISARKLEEYLDICEIMIEGIPSDIAIHDFWVEFIQQLRMGGEGIPSERDDLPMAKVRESVEETFGVLDEGLEVNWATTDPLKENNLEDNIIQLERAISKITNDFEEHVTLNEVEESPNFERLMYLREEHATIREELRAIKGIVSVATIEVSGGLPGESRHFSVSKNINFEEGVEIEWLSSSLALAALETCEGLNLTVKSRDLARLIAKAIEEEDLILFVDALDECRDPSRTAKFLQALTSGGILRHLENSRIGDNIRGYLQIHEPDSDTLGNDNVDWNMMLCPGVPEMYLSSRPEKMDAIPERLREDARFCKLQYTDEEITDLLPRGLLRAWGIDSKRILTLALGARWKYPFAFLNPWSIGHALKMIESGEMALEPIHEWDDAEFSNQLTEHVEAQHSRQVSRMLEVAIVEDTLRNDEGDWGRFESSVMPTLRGMFLGEDIHLHEEQKVSEAIAMLSKKGDSHQINRGVILRFIGSHHFGQLAATIDKRSRFKKPLELSPTSEKEARFFLRILESSIRNSLDRKGRLGDISDEDKVGLIQEVADLLGVISIHDSSVYRGTDFESFEGFIEKMWERLAISSEGHFPILMKKKSEFMAIFTQDLTSLYSLPQRGRIGEWVDWEHKRMRDVAGLRLIFSPDERVERTRLSLVPVEEKIPLPPGEAAVRGIFSIHALEAKTFTRLSVDWIEIGFAISMNEDYFQFLERIDAKSKNLPFGLRRENRLAMSRRDELGRLIWDLIDDNGFSDQAIDYWVKYYTSRNLSYRLKGSPPKIPFPDSFPLGSSSLGSSVDEGEMIYILFRTWRGTFSPFVASEPRWRNQHRALGKMKEYSLYGFSILRSRPELAPQVSDLWDEMNSGSGDVSRRFASGLISLLIPNVEPKEAEFTFQRPGDHRWRDVRGAGRERLDQIFEPWAYRANLEEGEPFMELAKSSPHTLVNWIDSLSSSGFFRNRNVLRESIGRGYPLSERMFSSPNHEIEEWVNSMIIEALDSQTANDKPYYRSRDFRLIQNLGGEITILNTLARSILLFQPRSDSVIQDITIFSSVLSMLREIFDSSRELSGEHSDIHPPLIRPEAIDMHGHIPESAYIIGPVTWSYLFRLKSGWDGQAKFLSKLEHGDLRDLLDNMGLSTSGDQEDLVDRVVANIGVIDPVWSYSAALDSNNRIANKRLIRKEILVRKMELKRILSTTGVVSILFGDLPEEPMARTQALLTKSAMEEHRGTLDILFGDLSEYYTPYL